MCIMKLLKQIVSNFEEKHNELGLQGSLGISSLMDLSGFASSSLSCLIQCPLFHVLGVENLGESHKSIYLLIEQLLFVLRNLIKDSLVFLPDDDFKEERISPFPSTDTLHHSSSRTEKGLKILDMELDADEGPKEIETPSVDGDRVPAVSFSVIQCKLDLISCVSAFSTVLPSTTQEVMFDLLEAETDAKVVYVSKIPNFQMSTS